MQGRANICWCGPALFVGTMSELCADAFGNLVELLWTEFKVRVCKPHVCFALHGYKMDVCMGNLQSQYALAHLDAGDGLADGYCHFLGKDLQSGNLFVVQIENVVHLVFGNDKSVSFLEGADVKEGEVFFVLGNLVAWYFACYYA